MVGYIVRRLLDTIVVVFIVTLFVFVLLHAMPGGMVRSQLGIRASPVEIHALEQQEGLLHPLPEQYLIWLGNLVHGSLGFSYKLNQSVGSLLGEYVPRTLLLVGAAETIALAIAVPAGLWQGKRRNHLDDHGLTAIMMTFYSMPSFLLGVVLIVILNIWLGILPATAQGFGTGWGADLLGLVLPVMTLALAGISYFSRYMRSAVIDSLLEDYVRTAYAKGASGRRVLFRHVLRNSLLGTVTLVGLAIPYVLSGSLIVEALFDFPGVGLLFFNAAQDRDYPVLLGVLLVITLATVVGNLLADIAYAVLDPRVRY
ncbi:MAG: ABC transporter permease [Acidimicrobiales bacterium]